MPRVFISYRRPEQDDLVFSIRSYLNAYFRDDAFVYQDVEDIPTWESWTDAVERSIPSCRAMIVPVGPDWASHFGGEKDPLLFELRTAIAHGVPLCPIRVHGGTWPSEDAFPASVRDAFRNLNAPDVRSGEHFKRDMQHVAETLGGLVLRPRQRLWLTLRRHPVLAMGAAVLVLIAAAVLLLAQPESSSEREPMTLTTFRTELGSARQAEKEKFATSYLQSFEEDVRDGIFHHELREAAKAIGVELSPPADARDISLPPDYEELPRAARLRAAAGVLQRQQDFSGLLRPDFLEEVYEAVGDGIWEALRKSRDASARFAEYAAPPWQFEESPPRTLHAWVQRVEIRKLNHADHEKMVTSRFGAQPHTWKDGKTAVHILIRRQTEKLIRAEGVVSAMTVILGVEPNGGEATYEGFVRDVVEVLRPMVEQAHLRASRDIDEYLIDEYERAMSTGDD